MGNRAPLADLMVVSPEQKEMFLVDVKGQYSKGFWIIKPKQARERLFYILALVPAGEANQFFLMSQDEVNALLRSEQQRLKHPDDYTVQGLNWTLAFRHRDAWHVLPK
jgi:hypothetical protein